MSQVISVHTNFIQSDPAIKKRLEFADLLGDVGYYGVSNACQGEALQLLQTGEIICTALLDCQPAEIRPVLGNILGPLNVLVQYLGVDGRLRALNLNQRQIDNREKQLVDIPRDQWTQLDFVNFGRASNDMGVSLTQLNKVEEATSWFDSALDYCKSVGSEDTLASRFGHIYSFQLLPLAFKKKSEEAHKLSQRARTLVAKAVGKDSPLELQTKFLTATTFFTLGDVDEALELHKDVFEKRLLCQSNGHHLTLGSQYSLAACYQNVNNIERAEKHLRQILKNGCITMQWRMEDVVRTKFRLSIILRTQNRPVEASATREEIHEYIKNIRLTAGEYTDEDDMKLLDFEVSIFHGRTTGVWSNGKFWYLRYPRVMCFLD